MSIFDLVPTHKLVTVQRQALDNPSLRLATQYREAIDHGPAPVPFDEGPLTITSDSDTFRKQMLEHFLEYDGTDHRSKVLTYTNQAANDYNQLIRNYLQPAMADVPIFNGEILVANSPVFDAEAGRIAVPTEAQVEVMSHQRSELVIGGETIAIFMVRLNHEDKLVTCLVCEDPNTRAATIKRLKRRAMDAKAHEGTDAARPYWREYFAVEERLADLRPSFACTTHKAQGSTLDAVFVDVDDIYRCRNPIERNRLMYVSLTRTRNENHLLWSGK